MSKGSAASQGKEPKDPRYGQNASQASHEFRHLFTRRTDPLSSGRSPPTKVLTSRDRFGGCVISKVDDVLSYSLYHQLYTMASTTEPQAPGSTPRAQKISYASTHSKLGTLWSRSLPDYSGGYPVGAVDVEFPVEKQRIGRFVHKKVPGNEGGIEIDTVLFTLFYPAEVDGKREKGALWFPRLVEL